MEKKLCRERVKIENEETKERMKKLARAASRFIQDKIKRKD